MSDPALQLHVLLREARAVTSGTVVCAAVIAGGAGQTASIRALCAAILVTVGAYWLAGIYSGSLAMVITQRVGVGTAIRSAVKSSWLMAAASLLPVVVLVIAAAAGAALATAATIALLATVGLLAVYGAIAGRAGGFGIRRTTLSALAGASIGVLLIVAQSLHV